MGKRKEKNLISWGHGVPKILNITNEAILDVVESGMTLAEGAEVLGCSVNTLSRRIAKLQAEQGILLKYRSLQSLHLTQLQSRLLEAVTPEKIASAELRDLVMAFKVLKDKELNLDGKPSEIKGLVSYLVHLEKERTGEAGGDLHDKESRDFVDYPLSKLSEGEWWN